MSDSLRMNLVVCALPLHTSMQMGVVIHKVGFVLPWTRQTGGISR
jgi:hypothetical protein